MQPKLFNTYEECCAFLGIEPIASPDLSWVQPQNRKAIVAQEKLFVWHEAHNKANNFVADWSNADQLKYSTWHWIKADTTTPSGFGFSGSVTFDWDAGTGVGSRLCVGTETERQYIASKCSDLYHDWYFFDKVAVSEMPFEDDKSAEGGEYDQEMGGI